MIRFPHSEGITTLVENRHNYNPDAELREEEQILTEKQPEVHETGQPDEGADLTEQILVNPHFPDQIITIGGRLSPDWQNRTKDTPNRQHGDFAWEPPDMT
ncbi:hypothetical protein Tco_0174167 [Tanacetum coccineum]